MMKTAAGRGLAIVVLCGAWAFQGVAAAADPVAEALAEMRDVKADMFSRHSSVLGKLPGPAELAAAQMRTRPIPSPRPGGPGTVSFTAEQKRAFAREYKGKPLSSFGKTGRCGPKAIPLGITGAQVTEFLNRKELFVAGVAPGTPAAGVLEPLDVIIGANGRLFTDPEDPRPAMGYALTESQSPQLGGKLTLQIVRDGVPTNVRMTLGDTQSYSATWSFDCGKSDRLRAAALRCVLDSDLTSRYTANWSWVPMFLMASGDDEALERARRVLYRGLKPASAYPAEVGGMNCWIGGYRLINLCEYYLLTGDSAVLPEIQYVARVLEKQQYPTGGWTHGGPGGYGQINCCGLGCFIGLILARECGVEVDAEELAIAIRYFGKWCGTNLPYGEGAPGGRSGRMDNGMNSMSAIAFHLLGEKAMAERWARSVCYMWMGRDKGHAEGIFSLAWGPLGAALAPKAEFHMFMNRMLWYYEMGRTPDDAYVYMRGSRQPYPGGTTSAVGLFFYLPEHRIRLLGAPRSVFGTRPPAPLAKAAALYRQKQWAALRGTLEAYLRQPNRPHEAYAKALLAAHKRMERHAAATLALIKGNIQRKKLATAGAQLDALKRLLGEERPVAAALRRSLGGRLADPPQPKRQYAAFNPKWTPAAAQLKRGGVRDGFAHSPDYIAGTNALAFEGLSPEQIARFLAHFNGGPYGGAARAMVAHGESIVPLLMKLMGDENPWLRGAAVGLLGDMHRHRGSGKEPRRPDARVTAAVARVGRLVDDPHAAVQAALGAFVQKVRLETPETRRIVVKMAGSDDAGVRYTAANMARLWLSDPETLIRIGTLVSEAPKGNTPRHWQFAHMAIARNKADPRCRKAIPVMAAYLRNTANTVPIRGFFSDSAQHVPLKVMAAQWDAEVQAMPNVVAGVCCAYVRTSTPPVKQYRGWHALRETAKGLLDGLTPAAAPALREAIAEQKKWLADVDDARLKLILQLGAADARRTVHERLAYLEALAAKLKK